MFWSTSCVLRYSFKLFICLKCIVYCYYIKYDKSYYYTDNESRWFFNKRASSMRILFNSFSFLHFLLSFFISFSFTLRHLISVFIYFLIFLLSNFFFHALFYRFHLISPLRILDDSYLLCLLLDQHMFHFFFFVEASFLFLFKNRIPALSAIKKHRIMSVLCILINCNNQICIVRTIELYMKIDH